MKIEVVATSDVRRALSRGGDLRADVAFQNDVNALLARVEQMTMPWRAIADTALTEPSRPIVTDVTPGPRVRPVGLPIATPARTRTLDGIGLAPIVVEANRRRVASRR